MEQGRGEFYSAIYRLELTVPSGSRRDRETTDPYVSNPELQVRFRHRDLQCRPFKQGDRDVVISDGNAIFKVKFLA